MINVLIFVSLSFISYKFLSSALSLYDSEIPKAIKVAFLVALSLVVIMALPCTYLFRNYKWKDNKGRIHSWSGLDMLISGGVLYTVEYSPDAVHVYSVNKTIKFFTPVYASKGGFGKQRGRFIGFAFGVNGIACGYRQGRENMLRMDC